MIVMTFDLSSTKIGVTFAQIEGRAAAAKIAYAQTLAIMPHHPTADEMGYTTAAPKKIRKGASVYDGLLRPGEGVISQAEAARRISEFKSWRHNQLLRDIGMQCGRYLGKVRPHIVALEKNKSFNGILTTKLLAEIAGGLYFHCGSNQIPLYDWDEATIRAQIRRDITDFSLATPDGTVVLDTKWEIFCRLRSYFSKECPGMFTFETMSMDESDSLAVFYYLWTQVIREGRV